MEKLTKICDLWFNLDDKIRFLFVGGFNFVVSYIVYSILCIILGESAYQIALVLSWALCSIVSYTTQRYFVFESRGDWLKEYLKCCTTWVCSYCVNAFLLEILVRYVHMNVFLSQLIANFTAAVLTYILFKYFAFKHK